MSAGTVAELKIETFSFFVRATDVELAPVSRGSIDWRVVRWMGAALAFHGTLLAMFALVPQSASALNLDASDQNTRYLQIALMANEQVPPPPSNSGSQGTTDQAPAP